MPKIAVTGVPEIDKRLKELEPRIARKLVRQAIRQALKEMDTALEAVSPRKSGALASSYKVRASGRSRKSIGMDLASTVAYASFINYGAPHRHIKAQRFADEAYKENAPSIRDRAMELLVAGIQKEIDSL
jgi:HK97 gp10 family phage protein